MKKNIWKFFSVGVLVAMLASCDSEPEKTDYNISYNKDLLPAMQTGDIVLNCGNTAVIEFSLNNNSGISISEQGVIFNTSQALNIVDSQIIRASLDEDGSSKVILDGLTPSTTYYYRAYSYTNEGISYGEVKSFTTESKEWKREMIYAADFYSANSINDFTVIKLAGDGKPWHATPISIKGLPDYGFASSSLSVPALFNGQVVPTGDADNLLQYEADFTGKTLPMVSLYAIDVDGLLVGAGRSSSLEVLVSSSPITTAAEANAAEVIKRMKFSPKEVDIEASLLLPIKYNNTKCYIAIRNKAAFANSIGVLVADFYTSSLIKPE